MISTLHANDRQGHYPRSFYHADAAKRGLLLDHLPPLQGEARCDVAVVGGGYCGLSTALNLAERGYDVALLEAHRVGWGASGRNGGQAGSGQRKDYGELIDLFGKQEARRLMDLAFEAKRYLKELVAQHHIDCDLVDGYMHVDHRERYLAETLEDVELCRDDLGIAGMAMLSRQEVIDRLGTEAYFGGSFNPLGGHLQPLNYALGLAKAALKAGARLYECSEVLDIEEGNSCRLKTATGTLKADHVVLACNGYGGELSPSVAKAVMPINNFIVATEPLATQTAKAINRDNVAVSDSRFVINYWRMSADNRLLFGGGETYGYRFPKDIAALVRKPMLGVYPQLADTKIDYAWGGTLAITQSRLPDYRRLAPNMLSVAGFSGYGVVQATFAGKLIAEAIAGQSERFDVFEKLPKRDFPGSFLGPPKFRQPLLALAMLYYGLLDRL